MPPHKCQSCDYFGRWRWFNKQAEMWIVENWERNWEGCKLKHKPSNCWIDDEIWVKDRFMTM